jgi:hypothetical protein
MGNLRFQSTLLRMGFYREIPVDRAPVESQAPDIASPAGLIAVGI